MVDRLKSEYEGRVEFRLLNVDTDAEGAALASELGAQFVPTFVFLNADGSKSDMFAGGTEDQIVKALDKLK